jgi:hypothetical protein
MFHVGAHFDVCEPEGCQVCMQMHLNFDNIYGQKLVIFTRRWLGFKVCFPENEFLLRQLTVRW